MDEQEVTQDHVQTGLQSMAQMIDQQNTMLSEFMDSQKGSFGTVVRGTAIKQDVGGDELLAHQVAALSIQHQFWTNQIMFQTSLMNTEALRAMSNNNAVTNQQNWNGTGLAQDEAGRE